MSRIGNKPVVVPDGVTITLAAQALTAKGKLGELSMTVVDQVVVHSMTYKLNTNCFLQKTLREESVSSQSSCSRETPLPRSLRRLEMSY